MDFSVGLAGSGAVRIVNSTAQDEINQAIVDVGVSGGGTVKVLAGTYGIANPIAVAG
jgi:hypothetical protein